MRHLTFLVLGLSSSVWVAVACASGGGEGSETHFVCETDAECAARNEGVCVAHRCSKVDAGAGSGSTGDSASSGGGTGSGGSSDGGSGGNTDASDGGALCPAGEPLHGTGPGFAPLYGCHETRRVANDPAACFPPERIRYCTGPGNYLPSELPCGTCTAGDRCYTGIVPVCDCDGDGPMPSFLQDPNGDQGYVDGWLCQCVSGTWRCLLRDQSGVSCFEVCGPDSGVHERDGAVGNVEAGSPDAR